MRRCSGSENRVITNLAPAIAGLFIALLAPAKTPPEIIRVLNSEINKMVTKPAIVAKFAELGAEPLGGSPQRAAAFIAAEQEKWGKIIRDAAIKLN